MQKAQARLEEVQREIDGLRLKRRDVENSLEATIADPAQLARVRARAGSEGARGQGPAPPPARRRTARRARRCASLDELKVAEASGWGGQLVAADPVQACHLRVMPRPADRPSPGSATEILLIKLAAAPVDGAANDALVALLSEVLHIPKRSIRIKSGERSRTKIVEIDGVSDADVLTLLTRT